MTKPVKYGLGLLLGVGLLLALLFVPWSSWALGLVEWIRGAGALGVVVYVIAYFAATLLLLPGSILTAGAGLAYDPLWGTLLVSPVSVLSAAVAFLLGRGVARNWVGRRIARYPRFSAIDEAIGDSGFKIILLLRLSPIFPFNLLNYALGLTRISFRDYVVASFLGMLPGTFLYVYLGSLVTSASELLSGKRGAAGPWGHVLYWGGLVATLIATIFVTKIAKQALNKALERKQQKWLHPDSEVRP